jgi:hypothetical protein
MEIDNNKFYQLPTGSSSPLPNRGNINCWISTPFKVLICRMMSQLQRQKILMLSQQRFFMSPIAINFPLVLWSLSRETSWKKNKKHYFMINFQSMLLIPDSLA